MSELTDITAAHTPADVAEIIRGNPEAAARFEEAYRQAMDAAGNDDGLLGPNPRAEAKGPHAGQEPALDDDLIDGIITDLVDQTPTWATGRGYARAALPPEGTDNTPAARTALAAALPEAHRPQATGTALTRQIPADSGPLLCWHLTQSLDESLPPERRQWEYHQFRQGLDILDLDPVSYAIIDTNPDSIGAWLPPLEHANNQHGFFRIPRTTIARVPLPLLQLTRIDYEEINPVTHRILNEWAWQVFNLYEHGDYFIKTGTFSSKFDFRNARVRDPSEVHELGDYLTVVHQQALSMASPLSETPTYGAGTTTQWAVREFIPAAAGTPTIYHGLPLRTEFRVFVDADTNTVLSAVPYWDPKVMTERFSEWADADHPDNRHDLVTFLAVEPALTARFERYCGTVVDHVRELLPDLALTGQWSVDVMLSGGDFWLIDMAQAKSSAFRDSIPADLRRISTENWIPTGRLSLTDGEQS